MSPHTAHLAAALSALRRPLMLVRAARFGLTEYRRDRDLRRLLAVTAAPSPESALDQLLAAEEEVELRRRTGAATYSVARHIDLLVALIAESRLLVGPVPGAAPDVAA